MLFLSESVCDRVCFLPNRECLRVFFYAIVCVFVCAFACNSVCLSVLFR